MAKKENKKNVVKGNKEKKKIDKRDIAVKVMAGLLAALMVFAVGGTLFYYLMLG